MSLSKEAMCIICDRSPPQEKHEICKDCLSRIDKNIALRAMEEAMEEATTVVCNATTCFFSFGCKGEQVAECQHCKQHFCEKHINASKNCWMCRGLLTVLVRTRKDLEDKLPERLVHIVSCMNEPAMRKIPFPERKNLKDTEQDMLWNTVTGSTLTKFERFLRTMIGRDDMFVLLLKKKFH